MNVQEGNITIAPATLVSSIGTHDVILKHTFADGAVEKKVVTVQVKADCSKAEFEPLPKFPEAISVRQTLTYDVPAELKKDSEGASWSQVCGKASIAIEGAPAGVSLLNGQITIDGTFKGLEAGQHTFTIVQKTDNGAIKKTPVTFVVNCSIISYDKTAASEQIKDNVYYNSLGSVEEVMFSFVAVPERCGNDKKYVVTVNGQEQPEWITVVGTSVHISTKDNQLVGTYPVKITSTVSGIRSSRDIDFNVNFFLAKCLDGSVSPTNSLEDFTFKPIEKQNSYNPEFVGTQKFNLNQRSGIACASTVKYTPQVQLPNTKVWIDFNEANAPAIAKYL